MDIKADLWFPTVVWNFQLKEVNDAELRTIFNKTDKVDRIFNDILRW